MLPLLARTDRLWRGEVSTADPGFPHAAVNARRTESLPSTMSQGIFGAAAGESGERRGTEPRS